MTSLKSLRPQAFVVILVSIAMLIALVLFMQRTRTIEGTWIDLFEDSTFFEGQTVEEACSPSFDDSPYFAFQPELGTAFYEMRNENIGTRGKGTFISEHGNWNVSAYSVKFIGHQDLFGLYGHLGSRNSQFVVDEMISMNLIDDVHCDIR